MSLGSTTSFIRLVVFTGSRHKAERAHALMKDASVEDASDVEVEEGR
jgi:hypothetical protein